MTEPELRAPCMCGVLPRVADQQHGIHTQARGHGAIGDGPPTGTTIAYVGRVSIFCAKNIFSAKNNIFSKFLLT